jgi:excisionase family DNA binding protein
MEHPDLRGESVSERTEWFFPLSQAAEILDCHWREVLELIEQGKLEFIRLPPNKIRVSKASLLDYR